MAEPFLGEIRMFGGNFAPSGWALCNGQVMSISQNTALFSLLGTTYGGNGQTTFALPNLQSRVPIHWGQGNGLSAYVIGEASGVENVALTTQQMPQHNHLVNCDSQATMHSSLGFGQSAGASPKSNYPGLAASAGEGVYSGSANANMNAAMIATAGNSQSHTNLQPFLVVTFIIALEGIYPARN